MPVQSIMDRIKQQEADLTKDMERSFNTRSHGGNFRSLFIDNLPFPKFHLKNGEYMLDFIPYFCGDKDPLHPPGAFITYLDLMVHGWIGPNKDSFVCLVQSKMGGAKGRCAACEEVAWMESKEFSEEAIKQVQAKRKAIYYVHNHNQGEEAKGLQIMEASFHLLQKHLIEQSKQPDSLVSQLGQWIEYAHPLRGKRVFFRHEGAKKGTRITGIKFFDRPVPQISDVLLTNASKYPLDQLIAIPNYEELKEDFMSWRSVAEEGEAPPPVYQVPANAPVDQRMSAGSTLTTQYSNACPQNLTFGESFGANMNCFTCVVKDDCMASKMKTTQEAQAPSRLPRAPATPPPVDDEIPF